MEILRSNFGAVANFLLEIRSNQAQLTRVCSSCALCGLFDFSVERAPSFSS
jgi:hypothetical protein